MPSHRTTVEIAVPPSLVWDVTCDVESWPTWSPTMDEVRRADAGPIAEGSTALVRQPSLRPATWTVDDVRPDRSFDWHTSGPGYRVLATHRFEPTGDGTLAHLAVTVDGPLALLVWLLTGPTVPRYVHQEAAAHNRRCEA